MISLGLTLIFSQILNPIFTKTLGTKIAIVYAVLIVSFFLSLIITLGLQLIRWHQKVYAHLTKYHGAKCFEEIDSCISNLGENNGYYCSVIYKLNNIYETNPELAQLIKENDLETLYDRKSYLENNLDFHNTTIGIFSAFGISLAAALAQFGITGNGVSAFGSLMFSGVILLLCITIKYVSKGNGDSYIYNLQEYELKLISKKILLLNEQLQITADIEKALQLQHLIAHELGALYSDRRRLRKAKLRKKNILELYKELYTSFPLQELGATDIIWAKINGYKSNISFPLKIENGEYHFLNESYKKIYEILQKT